MSQEVPEYTQLIHATLEDLQIEAEHGVKVGDTVKICGYNRRVSQVAGAAVYFEGGYGYLAPSMMLWQGPKAKNKWRPL